jgi:hypothetical protein
MRDGINLLKKSIIVDETVYKIVDFCYIPDSSAFYVKLKNSQGMYVNYEYKKLQPIIQKQLKL